MSGRPLAKFRTYFSQLNYLPYMVTSTKKLQRQEYIIIEERDCTIKSILGRVRNCVGERALHCEMVASYTYVSLTTVM